MGDLPGSNGSVGASNVPVDVHCLPIPDGMDDGGKTVRLSLVLTPLPPAGTGGIDLAQWPEAITAAILSGRLAITVRLPGKDPRHLRLAPSDDDVHRSDTYRLDPAAEAGAAQAQRLWQRLLGTNPAGYQQLMDFLHPKRGPAPTGGSVRAQFLSIGSRALQDFAQSPANRLLFDPTAPGGGHQLSITDTRSYQASDLLNHIQDWRERHIGHEMLRRMLSHQLRKSVGENSALAAQISAHPLMRLTRRAFQGALERLYWHDPAARSFLVPADSQAYGRLDVRISGSERQRSLAATSDLASQRAWGALNELIGGKNEFMESFVRQRESGRNLLRSLDARLNGAAPSDASDGFAFVQQLISEYRDWFAHTAPLPSKKRDARRRLASGVQILEAITSEKFETLKRRWIALRTYPVLAKHVRLVVDVAFDTERLGFASIQDGEIGAVMLRDSSDTLPAIDSHDRVAFHYQGAVAASATQAASPAQFRPATAAEVVASTDARVKTEDKALPLQNGVVNLQAPSSGGARFSLHVIDLQALVGAARQQTLGDVDAMTGGAMVDSVSAKVTQMRGRGIQLLDRDAVKMALAQQADAAISSDEDSVPRLYYAEDLVVGYRVDVLRKPPQAALKPWRTLVQRHVEYFDLQASYTKGGDRRPKRTWRPLADSRERERENGQVRIFTKIAPKDPAKPGGDKGAQPSEYVFTWFGDSLALPTQPDDPKQAPAVSTPDSPGQDLQLGIRYSYADVTLPVLRIGSSYRFGMRPVYVHGGGPRLDEAVAVYRSEPSLTLGDSQDSTDYFRFGQPDDVGAPVIAIGRDDVLAGPKFADAKNETHETFVLRSDAAKEQSIVRRYLVPPRAEFNRLEQFGWFDADKDATIPRGAFEAFDIDPKTGNFASIPSHVIAKKEQVGRAIVLRRAAGRTQQIQQPYYPDPMARNFCVSVEREGTYVDGFPQWSPPRSFWDDGKSPRTAKPIELEIRAWREAELGGRFDIDTTRTVYDGVDIPKLILDVAPAEDVTLWLWCLPDLIPTIKARPNFVFAAVAAYGRREQALRLSQPLTVGEPISVFQRLARMSARPAAAAPFTAHTEAQQRLMEEQGRKLMTNYLFALADGEHETFVSIAFLKEHEAEAKAIFQEVTQTLTDALFEPSPFSGMTGYTTARVVHAVDRPLAVPRLPKALPGIRPLQPVRLRRETVWADLNNATNFDDVLKAGGEPGGTEIYFTGLIAFDRPSTGDLRVEARRVDFRYEAAVRKVKVDGKLRYEDRPPVFDTPVFTLKGVPRDRGNTPAGYIDVGRDELGNLRNITDTGDPAVGSGGLAKTAALEFDLRFVATSRFADYFPDEDRKRPASTLSKFEVESRAVTRPGTYWPVAEKVVGDRIRCVLPATARPPRPTVTRIEWITPERRSQAASGALRIDKWFIPRLYLDNTWRASGIHELLAVTLLPTGSVSDHPYNPDAPRPIAVHPASPQPLDPAEAKRQGDLHRVWMSKPTDTSADILKFYDPFPKDADKNPMGCATTDFMCPIPDAETTLRFVSRWGADAATAALGDLEALMPSSQFSGYVGSFSRLDMPQPAVKDPANPAAPAAPTISVSGLLFKPEIDPDTGEWFVDMPIDPGLAHLPFVRLSIARYQRYAMPGLELSEPTLLDAIRVPAKRSVEIYNRNDEALVTHIYGVGNVRREPYGITAEMRAAADTPLQNVELVRLIEDQADTRVQAFDQTGGPVRMRIQPTRSNGTLVWVCEIALPKARRKQRYGLRIDEVNLHLPDAAIDRDTPPTMSDLVEQQGYFSLTVDLVADGLVGGGQHAGRPG